MRCKYILVFFLISIQVFAQTDTTSQTDLGSAEELVVKDDEASTVNSEELKFNEITVDAPVIINKISATLKRGITNPNSFLYSFQMKEGNSFASTREFLAELRRKLGLIHNTGYFKKLDVEIEAVSAAGAKLFLSAKDYDTMVSYSYNTNNKDAWANPLGLFYNDDSLRALINNGELRLNINIVITDQWTIYPIPLPVYSTAEGFGLKLKLKWDNFLGLLANVDIGVNWSDDINSSSSDFDFGAGISGLRLNDRFSLGFSLYQYHKAASTYTQWSTTLGASLGISLPIFERISTNYSASLSFSPHYGLTPISAAYKITQGAHFYNSIAHSFSISHLSSKNDFNSGFSASVSNSFSFDSSVAAINGVLPTAKYGLESIKGGFSLFLGSIYDWINFKGRLSADFGLDFTDGSYNPGGSNVSSGGKMRGISSANEYSGRFGFYINMDLAIRVFEDKLIGAKVILEPFFDLGFNENGRSFKLEDVQLSSGFDLSLVFHSLVLRYSFGIDLMDPQNIEMSISTGFFF